jgi:hypothetical protein
MLSPTPVGGGRCGSRPTTEISSLSPTFQFWSGYVGRYPKSTSYKRILVSGRPTALLRSQTASELTSGVNQ